MKYLNSKEVASIMCVNVSTIKRWTDSGKLDCYQTVGGHRKFLLSHLKNFLKEKINQKFRINIIQYLNKGEKELVQRRDDKRKAKLTGSDAAITYKGGPEAQKKGANTPNKRGPKPQPPVKLKDDMKEEVQANKGGMMMKKKKTGYAAGGMPMVMKGGVKVPAFAADGKGKMNMGGMAKKKPAAKMMAGGMATKKKPAAKKMMAGGMTKKSGYMYGGMAKKKMKK